MMYFTNDRSNQGYTLDLTVNNNFYSDIREVQEVSLVSAFNIELLAPRGCHYYKGFRW